MKFLILFAVVSIGFISCKEKTEETQTGGASLSADLQNYETEIMKIHDRAMPKMSEMNRLSSQLRDIKSKTGETDEGKPVRVEGLDDALESLRKAEQSMMDWMKNYSETKAKINPDLMKTFYERELEKMTQVENNMLNSLEKATEWLAQNPAG